jgi:hypothetical protein
MAEWIGERQPEVGDEPVRWDLLVSGGDVHARFGWAGPRRREERKRASRGRWPAGPAGRKGEGEGRELGLKAKGERGENFPFLFSEFSKAVFKWILKSFLVLIKTTQHNKIKIHQHICINTCLSL